MLAEREHVNLLGIRLGPRLLTRTKTDDMILVICLPLLLQCSLVLSTFERRRDLRIEDRRVDASPSGVTMTRQGGMSQEL
ncbi:hypothetical protein HBI43_170030 [Parastagonospora nodorum]|nr:hypothetical protein HBI43_170030 [Parastagonospora nodorum]